MSIYKNYMETLVEEVYSRCKDSLPCCTCERCRDDVIAYALNRLPPRYAVTPEGGVYTKITGLERQYYTDIVAALTQAAQVVNTNPRH